MAPAKVEAAPTLVKVAAEEEVTEPPRPASRLTELSAPTAWLLPFRSSTLPVPLRRRSKTVGTVAVGLRRMVLAPPESRIVPPLMTVPLVPAVPV